MESYHLWGFIPSFFHLTKCCEFIHMVLCMSIYFYDWITFHVDIAHFVYLIHLLMGICCCYLFYFVKSAAINTQYRYLFGHPISSSSGHMSSSGIPESCGNSVFNFLRTWQNVFHRGHPILHSHILLFATSVILHYFLYGQSGECDLVSMSLTWFYGW
jgi:hypothetical protein